MQLEGAAWYSWRGSLVAWRQKQAAHVARALGAATTFKCAFLRYVFENKNVGQQLHQADFVQGQAKATGAASSLSQRCCDGPGGSIGQRRGARTSRVLPRPHCVLYWAERAERRGARIRALNQLKPEEPRNAARGRLPGARDLFKI